MESAISVLLHSAGVLPDTVSCHSSKEQPTASQVAVDTWITGVQGSATRQVPGY